MMLRYSLPVWTAAVLLTHVAAFAQAKAVPDAGALDRARNQFREVFEYQKKIGNLKGSVAQAVEYALAGLEARIHGSVPAVFKDRYPGWQASQGYQNEFARQLDAYVGKYENVGKVVDSVVKAESRLSGIKDPEARRSAASTLVGGLLAAAAYLANKDQAIEQEIAAAEAAGRDPSLVLAQLRTLWLMSGIPQNYDEAYEASRRNVLEELNEIERMVKSGTSRDSAKTWARIRTLSKSTFVVVKAGLKTAFAAEFKIAEDSAAIADEFLKLLRAAIEEEMGPPGDLKALLGPRAAALIAAMRKDLVAVRTGLDVVETEIKAADGRLEPLRQAAKRMEEVEEKLNREKARADEVGGILKLNRQRGERLNEMLKALDGAARSVREMEAAAAAVCGMAGELKGSKDAAKRKEAAAAADVHMKSLQEAAQRLTQAREVCKREGENPAGLAKAMAEDDLRLQALLPVLAKPAEMDAILKTVSAAMDAVREEAGRLGDAGRPVKERFANSAGLVRMLRRRVELLYDIRAEGASDLGADVKALEERAAVLQARADPDAAITYVTTRAEIRERHVASRASELRAVLAALPGEAPKPPDAQSMANLGGLAKVLDALAKAGDDAAIRAGRCRSAISDYRPPQVAEADVWVRTGPVYVNKGKEGQKPTKITVTPTSMSHVDEDGVWQPRGASNSITWTEPPAMLKVGQEVVLTINATTNKGALVTATIAWNCGEPATQRDYYVQSWPTGDPPVNKNVGRVVFKFKPQGNPTILVKTSRWDPTPDMYCQIIWRYELVKAGQPLPQPAREP